jgi:hypothetical protein
MTGEIPLNAFVTDNCALAVALHMAGVPFAFPDHPSQNEYFADTLKRNGQRARDLEKRGIPGKITWAFAHDSCGELIKHFDAEVAAIKHGAKSSELAADPIDFVKIAAHYAEVRKAMLNLWKLQPSFVTLTHPDGKTETISTNAHEP